MKTLLNETLSQFKEEIKYYFKTEIEKINTEVKDMKKAVEFLSSQYEEMLIENKKIKLEINDINKTTKDQNQQIMELEKIISQNTKQINSMENLSRYSNLEVHGICELPNENTNRIVFNTLKITHPEIKEKDIVSTFRVKKYRNNDQEGRKLDGPIIAKLVDHKTRFMCYSNKKKLAGYAFKDIGIEAERVFLNENLCPASRRLFYQANMQKKIARWRFI